jgi:hypothetical protein
MSARPSHTLHSFRKTTHCVDLGATGAISALSIDRLMKSNPSTMLFFLNGGFASGGVDPAISSSLAHALCIF